MAFVKRSFLGQADQKVAVTVSPGWNVEFSGTSALISPKLTPNGVVSRMTGGRRLICLSERSGGSNFDSMALPVRRAEASFLNS